MEKLIECYNEYNQKKNLKEYYNYIEDIELPEKFDSLIFLKDFCKWLVKNDKIDLDKVEQEAMGWFDDESPVYGKDIRTARLIMMLSVSNNPISDLVYYLK